MKKGRLFYRVSVGRIHDLKFTFNTLYGLSHLKLNMLWIFGQMIFGLRRFKDEVSSPKSLYTHSNL